MLADSKTHTCCSAFHSKKSIRLFYNRFGRGGFPSSTSPSTCAVFLYMNNVEDEIISQETHEERSHNTLDVQKKGKSTFTLLAKSQIIRRPTSMEEHVTASVKVTSDTEMENERKLFSSFQIFFFCDQFANQYGRIASKEP